jgi:penicillin-binding protein-related factor A (putative recombinase)
VNEQREFELFEARIRNEAPLQRVTAIQIPEKVVSLYRKIPIKVKSHVDYVLGIDGKIVVLDAKVTRERLWNLKKYVTHPGKIHQWAEISNSYSNGNLSGYLIWFVTLEKIVWAPAKSLIKIMEEGSLSIHPGTPGLLSQQDSVPIDFRRLIV